MTDYKYRYSAVRGLERRKSYESFWKSVDGGILERMTADELEECAKAMRKTDSPEKEE
ncbi:MAG: hypothetical protein ACOC8P_00430 [Dichotomicrobium sp.]